MPLSCGAHHSQQAVYSRSVALARREYDVRRTCTHAPYTYRTPSSRAGPLSVPKHARTQCPPPLSPWLHTFQIRTGDLRGCTRRGLALLVRAYRERVNGTILELASSRLGVRVSSRAFRTTCARPMSPPPFALTAAQPSPPAPPSRVPRAAQAPVHRMPHPPSPGGTSSPR